MLKATCPSCLLDVAVSVGNGRPNIGQHVLCPDCRADLTIIWLYPITLGLSKSNDSDQAVASDEGMLIHDNL
ncbi:MAG: hypothetical protein FJ010_12230 [Chloroflexi bacterium]|nr:hypothetical protein [Chloroflexota bacterium]